MKNRVPGLAANFTNFNKNGKVEPTESIVPLDGEKLIVPLLIKDDESQFWSLASLRSSSSVWENDQDDIYAELHWG